MLCSCCSQPTAPPVLVTPSKLSTARTFLLEVSPSPQGLFFFSFPSVIPQNFSPALFGPGSPPPDSTQKVKKRVRKKKKEKYQISIRYPRLREEPTSISRHEHQVALRRVKKERDKQGKKQRPAADNTEFNITMSSANPFFFFNNSLALAERKTEIPCLVHPALPTPNLEATNTATQPTRINN